MSKPLQKYMDENKAKIAAAQILAEAIVAMHAALSEPFPALADREEVIREIVEASEIS